MGMCMWLFMCVCTCMRVCESISIMSMSVSSYPILHVKFVKQALCLTWTAATRCIKKWLLSC